VPTYEYRCNSCEEDFEKLLPMSRYDEPQDCPHCGEGPAAKKVSGGIGFILRGDGWAGKNNRIAGQMRNKNRRLSGRENVMKNDAPSVTLVPNVGGERVDSWSEASKLAASQGKDTSGYDAKAKTEKTK